MFSSMNTEKPTYSNTCAEILLVLTPCFAELYASVGIVELRSRHLVNGSDIQVPNGKIGRLVSGWKILCYHWNNGYVLKLFLCFLHIVFLSHHLHSSVLLCPHMLVHVSVCLHELVMKRNCFICNNISYQPNLLSKPSFLIGCLEVCSCFITLHTSVYLSVVWHRHLWAMPCYMDLGQVCVG